MAKNDQPSDQDKKAVKRFLKDQGRPADEAKADAKHWQKTGHKQVPKGKYH